MSLFVKSKIREMEKDLGRKKIELGEKAEEILKERKENEELIEKYDKEYIEWEARLNEKEEVLNSEGKRIDKEKETLMFLKKKIDRDYTDQLNKLKGDMGQGIEKLRRNYEVIITNEYEKKMKQGKGEIECLNERIKRLDEEIGNLKSSNEDKEKSISSMRGANSYFRNRVGELEELVGEKYGEWEMVTRFLFTRYNQDKEGFMSFKLWEDFDPNDVEEIKGNAVTFKSKPRQVMPINLFLYIRELVDKKKVSYGEVERKARVVVETPKIRRKGYGIVNKKEIAGFIKDRIKEGDSINEIYRIFQDNKEKISIGTISSLSKHPHLNING